MVAVSILIPAFFVILYSLQWGKERSESWLMSMFFSFFQSLLVVDPIKVFVITAVITCILRKVQNNAEEDLLADSGDPIYNAVLSRDEEYLANKVTNVSQADMNEILMSRRARLNALKPVDPEELERQRIERQRQIKANEILREGATYLGFLLVVLFLSFQSRSKAAYMIKRDLQNLLIEGDETPFNEVSKKCILVLSQVKVKCQK